MGNASIIMKPNRAGAMIRYADGAKRRVSPQCMMILFALMGRPLVSRDELIETLWPDPDKEPECAESVLSTLMSHTRQILAFTPWYIRNCNGRGWILERRADGNA